MRLHYGRQTISEEDISAVAAVLGSDWLTQGPTVRAFEAAVAAYCGASHGVAVNSATSALHIACVALDVGPGDVVWTSANTFVASANCALYCGAAVDFIDIDENTWNMDTADLAQRLKVAATVGRLPKVVIPVHFAGVPCDMPAIAHLASEYGFHVIEDASHSLGAKSQLGHVGACGHSDITVFSFHPVKSITTAEGGMALTNSPQLAERMGRLRSHGRGADGRQVELGFNYRMNELSAALGLSQLARLPGFLVARKQLAKRYLEQLVALGLQVQRVPDGAESAWHLFVVRVAQSVRERLVADLGKAGVHATLHYSPVYLHPYFRDLGFEEGHCPRAEAYAREAVTLPLFPSMDHRDQERVIDICQAVNCR